MDGCVNCLVSNVSVIWNICGVWSDVLRKGRLLQLEIRWVAARLVRVRSIILVCPFKEWCLYVGCLEWKRPRLCV